MTMHEPGREPTVTPAPEPVEISAAPAEPTPMHHAESARQTFRAEPDLRMELFSQPRMLCAARGAIGAITQRVGFAAERSDQICLAVDESLSNIINHGYDHRADGRIWVSIWILANDRPGIRILIEDEASHVDLDDIKPRDLDDVRPGGLGVHIIRQVMDEVRYAHRQPIGMQIEMWAWVRDQAPAKKND